MFPAKSQRIKDVLGFSVAPLRLCEGKTFVAILIALSFLTTLVPIAGASANKANTMPCCVGKTAGHCDSGVAAKKPPQPKEPMCGLHNDTPEDDDITVVAEPTHTESHQASSSQRAAESASLSEPCRMDCGACTTGATRQQNRERAFLEHAAQQHSSTTSQSKYDSRSLLISANEDWKQTSPRGPPSDLR